MTTTPLLDAMEEQSPFAGAGLTPWRCREHADFAAEEEALIESYLSDKAIQENPIAWPHWQARAALLRRWRERQAAGDTTPRADEFGEWLVEIDGGAKVTIVWDPDVGEHRMPHAEYHGDVTETGYRSDFTGEPPAGVDVLAWLTGKASEIRAETIREWEQKQRRKPKGKRLTRGARNG